MNFSEYVFIESSLVVFRWIIINASRGSVLLWLRFKIFSAYGALVFKVNTFPTDIDYMQSFPDPLLVAKLCNLLLTPFPYNPPGDFVFVDEPLILTLFKYSSTN